MTCAFPRTIPFPALPAIPGKKPGRTTPPTSTGVRSQKGGINAPTVFNAAFHAKQFWDGRAANLQEQAGGPPLNPVEMGYEHPDDWKKIAAKLDQDAALPQNSKRFTPGIHRRDHHECHRGI